MSFWDSSAIVPLCLYETRSANTGRLWKSFARRYVCWITSVEIASAIARSEREHLIDERRRAQAEKQFVALEQQWQLVEFEARIIDLARTFPSAYGLKAGDSIHLASALVWCKENPKNKDFVSADSRLSSAAESAGFAVHRLQ